MSVLAPSIATSTPATGKELLEELNKQLRIFKGLERTNRTVLETIIKTKYNQKSPELVSGVGARQPEITPLPNCEQLKSILSKGIPVFSMVIPYTKNLTVDPNDATSFKEDNTVSTNYEAYCTNSYKGPLPIPNGLGTLLGIATYEDIKTFFDGEIRNFQDCIPYLRVIFLNLGFSNKRTVGLLAYLQFIFCSAYSSNGHHGGITKTSGLAGLSRSLAQKYEASVMLDSMYEQTKFKDLAEWFSPLRGRGACNPKLKSGTGAFLFDRDPTPRVDGYPGPYTVGFGNSAGGHHVMERQYGVVGQVLKFICPLATKALNYCDRYMSVWPISSRANSCHASVNCPRGLLLCFAFLITVSDSFSDENILKLGSLSLLFAKQATCIYAIGDRILYIQKVANERREGAKTEDAGLISSFYLSQDSQGFFSNANKIFKVTKLDYYQLYAWCSLNSMIDCHFIQGVHNFCKLKKDNSLFTSFVKKCGFAFDPNQKLTLHTSPYKNHPTSYITQLSDFMNNEEQNPEYIKLLKHYSTEDKVHSFFMGMIGKRTKIDPREFNRQVMDFFDLTFTGRQKVTVMKILTESQRYFDSTIGSAKQFVKTIGPNKPTSLQSLLQRIPQTVAPSMDTTWGDLYKAYTSLPASVFLLIQQQFAQQAHETSNYLRHPKVPIPVTDLQIAIEICKQTSLLCGLVSRDGVLTYRNSLLDVKEVDLMYKGYIELGFIKETITESNLNLKIFGFNRDYDLLQCRDRPFFTEEMSARHLRLNYLNHVADFRSTEIVNTVMGVCPGSACQSTIKKFAALACFIVTIVEGYKDKRDHYYVETMTETELQKLVESKFNIKQTALVATLAASPLAAASPLPASPLAAASPLPASPLAAASPLPASPLADSASSVVFNSLISAIIYPQGAPDEPATTPQGFPEPPVTIELLDPPKQLVMGGASGARGIEGLRPPGSASGSGPSVASGPRPGSDSATFDSNILKGLTVEKQKDQILHFINYGDKLIGFFDRNTSIETLMLIYKLINGKNSKQIIEINQAFIFFQRYPEKFTSLTKASDPISYIKTTTLDPRGGVFDETLKRILLQNDLILSLIPVITDYYRLPSVASASLAPMNAAPVASASLAPMNAAPVAPVASASLAPMNAAPVAPAAPARTMALWRRARSVMNPFRQTIATPKSTGVARTFGTLSNGDLNSDSNEVNSDSNSDLNKVQRPKPGQRRKIDSDSDSDSDSENSTFTEASKH